MRAGDTPPPEASDQRGKHPGGPVVVDLQGSIAVSNPDISTLAVDEKAAAKALNVSVAWLRKDRRTSRLIPFYRLGGCVRYSPDGIRRALADLQEGGAAPRGRRRGAQ